MSRGGGVHFLTGGGAAPPYPLWLEPCNAHTIQVRFEQYMYPRKVHHTHLVGKKINHPGVCKSCTHQDKST